MPSPLDLKSTKHLCSQPSLWLRCGQVTLAQLIRLIHSQLSTRRRELEKWPGQIPLVAGDGLRQQFCVSRQCRHCRAGVPRPGLGAWKAVPSRHKRQWHPPHSGFTDCFGMVSFLQLVLPFPCLSPGTRGLPPEPMRHACLLPQSLQLLLY